MVYIYIYIYIYEVLSKCKRDNVPSRRAACRYTPLQSPYAYSCVKIYSISVVSLQITTTVDGCRDRVNSREEFQNATRSTLAGISTWRLLISSSHDIILFVLRCCIICACTCTCYVCACLQKSYICIRILYIYIEFSHSYILSLSLLVYKILLSSLFSRV